MIWPPARPGLSSPVCVILLAALGVASAPAETLFANNIPGALPDTGASLFRVFGAMVLVIAIFLAGVWLFRNWERLAARPRGAPKLNIIEVKSLGQRQALYLVAYQQQRMLIASSPAGIALVSHLPSGEEQEAPAPVVSRSFAEAFQQVLARKL
jgi:flagellar biogenesis protein FliO